MQEVLKKIWDRYDNSFTFTDKAQKAELRNCLDELAKISENNRDADYYYLKGYIHYMSEPSDLKEAKKSFKQALEINPVHESSRLYFGHCLYDEKNYEEAEYNFSIVDKDEFNDFYNMKIEEMLVCCRVRISELDKEALSEAKVLIYKYNELDYLEDYLFNLQKALSDFGISIKDLATQSLNFRQAERRDLDRIVEMLAADFLGKQRENFVNPLPKSYILAFEEIDSDKNNELIVAELNDEVIGTLQITFTPSISFQGGKRATIESVRVDEKCRNLGIGKKFMQWAISRAKEENCVSMQLTTNEEREDAHRFYESLGFIGSHLGMKLKLK